MEYARNIDPLGVAAAVIYARLDAVLEALQKLVAATVALAVIFLSLWIPVRWSGMPQGVGVMSDPCGCLMGLPCALEWIKDVVWH